MQDKPECRTAVLKIKLGACLTGPTKRMAADLHAAAMLFNRARNAMVRHWERWCEDNPAAWADGKLSLPKGFSTQLYHAGRAVAPRLSAIIVASASNTILGSHLLKRTPWNHGGTCKRVWQAILQNEVARPCFREHGVKCPNATTKLSLGTDHATLSFALWSKDSGRKNTRIVCRIATGRMPRGLQQIIRRVAAGQDDWKLCDSEIVWKEGKRRGRGTWFFHMAYQRPPSSEQLDAANVATLSMLEGIASHPFEIASGTAFPWKLGDVGVLQAKYSQLETRRLVMRNRYRDAGSGRKGHGRGRIEAAIRPVSRQAHALMERFAKNIVAQVVKFCRRYDCGTLVWDAPRTKAKAAGWFAAKDIPFDWTRLQSQLEHRCWLFGIRIASGQVVDEKPRTARVAKSPAGERDRKTGRAKAGRVKSGKDSLSRNGAGHTGKQG